MRRLKYPWLWAALTAGTVLFLLELGRADITTSHEGRLVQTARQMAATEDHTWTYGAPVIDPHPQWHLFWDSTPPRIEVDPWIVPVLNRQVRLQKPPLPYWVVAVLFRYVAESEFMARLPSALMGLAAVVLVWDLARRWGGRRLANLSALVWVSSHFVIDEYRKAMADPYLAFFTLLAVWAWVAGSRRRKHLCLENADESVLAPVLPWAAILIFYMALALGVLAKGPMVVVHVALGAGAYTFSTRHAPGGWLAHQAGVLLLLAICLPWPIAAGWQVPNALEVWRYESIGRLEDNYSDVAVWWYYLPQLFLISMPWTPLWVAGIVLAVRRRRRHWFTLLWMGATVILLSLLRSKKNAYLLPMLPAQTLLIAAALRAVLAYWRRWKSVRMLAAAQAVVGVVGAVVVLAAAWKTKQADITISAVVALAAALAVLAWLRQPRPWLVAQTVAYALLLFAFVGFYRPFEHNRRSPREAAAALTQLTRENNVAFFGPSIPEAMSFYMPLIDKPWAGASCLLAVTDKGEGIAPDSLRNWYHDGGIRIGRRYPLPGPSRGGWDAVLAAPSEAYRIGTGGM